MVAELDVHWGGGGALVGREQRVARETHRSLALAGLCSRAVLATPTSTFIALARAMFEEANAAEVAGEDLRGPPASPRESGQERSAPQGLQVPGLPAGHARHVWCLDGLFVEIGKNKGSTPLVKKLVTV